MSVFDDIPVPEHRVERAPVQKITFTHITIIPGEEDWAFEAVVDVTTRQAEHLRMWRSGSLSTAN